MAGFVKREEAQWIELGNGQRRKFGAYNDQMMAVEVGFDAGAVGADHAHPHTQITYVLSGEYVYHIEHEPHTMRAGDSIVVPGGKVHGLTCVAPGSVLDIFSPMREDFVK